jgi:hypothetical protein
MSDLDRWHQCKSRSGAVSDDKAGSSRCRFAISILPCPANALYERKMQRCNVCAKAWLS